MATLAELQERRARYLAAEEQILSGLQEYSISAGPDGRGGKRASLAEIRAEIRALDSEIALATARASGRGRSFSPSPLW